MYERWRRLALICGIAGCLLLATWASFSPLVTVETVNPAAEQDRRVHGGYFPSEEDRALAALSPEEYLATITAGAVYHSEGTLWGKMFEALAAPAKADRTLRWWMKPDRSGGRSRARLFFHEDEEPVHEMVRWMDEEGLKTAYVATSSAPNRDLLRVSLESVGLDDFSLGSGWRGIVEPPSRLLFPGRRFALPFLLLCSAVYAVLPWPRRGATTVTYDRRRVIVADVVGTLLFGLFFTMPSWITGTAQGLVAYWPLTAGFWLMASFGAVILIRSTWYARWRVVVREDGLDIMTPGGVRSLPYSRLRSRRPVVLRSPRWLRSLMWLALFVRPEPALAGNAALMSGILASGDELELDDGSVVYLWHQGRWGDSTLTHGDVLDRALHRIPSSTAEVTEMVGFGAPASSAAPAGGGSER